MEQGKIKNSDVPLAKKCVRTTEQMFKQLKLTYTTEMPTEKLVDFMHLCGVDSSEHEEYALLKKVGHRGEQIHYVKLIKALEATTNEVNCKVSFGFTIIDDPYVIINQILKVDFEDKEEVNFNDIKQFFLKHVDQFQSEDVLNFLKEFIILLGRSKTIHTSRISSLIRNRISGYPK